MTEKGPESVFKTSGEQAAWVREFENGHNQRMVFGWNEWSKSICKHYKVDAVIDDFIKGEFVEGWPVIRSGNIPRDAMVVSGVVGVRPISALSRLQEVGANFLDYFSFLRHSCRDVKGIDFWDGFADDYASHRSFYRRLLDRLEDDRSRAELDAVLAFRLSGDLRHMVGFSDRQREQYFEPFLQLKKGEVFLDVGSFDGETTLEFVRRNPEYSQVHVFDPSPNNLLMIRERLGEVERVHIHELALGEHEELVRFAESGSSSRTSTDGEVSVRVVPLDSIEQVEPTLIKVDIEGAEAQFVRGAAGKIVRYAPNLAIASYHSGAQIRQVSDEVLNIRNGYSIYFRHYTEGFTESVLFFVRS